MAASEENVCDMSLEPPDNCKESVEKVFVKEKEKWHSKMLSVFDDQQPYHFSVAYGHEMCSGSLDCVQTAEELNNVHTALDRLGDMNKIDQLAVQAFNEVLSAIENEHVSPQVVEFLNERKKECAEVFEKYDEVASLCEKCVSSELHDCRSQLQEQSRTQEGMLRQVKGYLREVEKAGEAELTRLKDAVANHVCEMGSSWSDKSHGVYKEMNQQPSAMQIWSECSKALTSKELRDAFLDGQKEMEQLWKKAFRDLVTLSSELERYRFGYAMTKSKLERSIRAMEKNYRQNMPRLTSVQRRIARLIDRKTQLSRELIRVEEDIGHEVEEIQNSKYECCKSIASLKRFNRHLRTKALKQQRTVYEVKRCEVESYLRDVLDGDRYIHRDILNKTHRETQVCFTDDEGGSKRAHPGKNQSRCADETKEKEIQTLYDDEFANAYKLFVSSGDFVDLLNRIAQELGYILDFEYVNYVKDTLKFEKEVKWMELFKVFKIDFVDDFETLQNYMMNFCKTNAEGEMMIDIHTALDGFLQFACYKRDSRSPNDFLTDETQLGMDDDFWKAIDEAMPKSLLWESVMIQLNEYKDLLQSRQKLLTSRSNLVSENDELDSYLEAYYTYYVPADTR